MMRLARFPVGRFAYHNSPGRERREAWFASPVHQTGSGGTETGPEVIGPDTEATEEIDLVTTEEEAILTMPNVLLPNFQESCESVDLFRDILRRAQLLPDGLGKMIRTELKLKKHEDLLSIEASAVNIDRRSGLMKKILCKHPEITLLLAKKVNRSIEHHHELVGQIERRLGTALGKKIPIRQDHQIYARAQMPALRSLEQTLTRIPNGQLSPLLKDLERGAAELDSRNIAVRIGLLQAGQNESEMSEENRMAVRFLIECKRAWKREWHAESDHWSDIDPKDLNDEDYKDRQRKYMDSLEKQKVALSAFLDAQLSSKAQSVVKYNWKKKQDIINVIKGQKKELTLEQANVELLTLRNASGDKVAGYGAVALIDALDRHLAPLRDFGLVKPKKGLVTEQNKKRVKVTDEKFLDYAAEALPVLQESVKGGAYDLERSLEEKKLAQENIERWAHDTAQRLQRLNQLDNRKRRVVNDFLVSKISKKFDLHELEKLRDFFQPYASDDPQQRELDLKANPGQCISATDTEFNEDFRKNLSMLLDQCERDPDPTFGLEEQREEQENRAALAGIDDTKILEQIGETRSQLGTVLQELRLSEYVQHEVCKTLGVSQLLQDKNSQIQDMLREIQEGKSGPEADTIRRKNLPRAQSEMKNLKRVLDRLKGIKILDGDGNNHQNGVIRINRSKTQDEHTIAEYHEKGHAALWALKPAFPFLLATHREVLRTRAPLLRELGNFLFYQDIAAQMDTWRKRARTRLERPNPNAPIDPTQLEEETERVYMEKMFDELLVRHAQWVHENRKVEDNPSEERKKEIQLFQELDERRAERTPKQGSLKVLRDGDTEEDEGVQHLRDDVTLPRNPDAEEYGPRGPAPEEEQINIQIELREIQRNIEMIQYFIKAYPETEEELEPFQVANRQELDKLNTMFLRAQQIGRSPEDDPELVQRVRTLRKNTKAIMEAIKKIDNEQLDISKVAPTKPKGLFDGIQLVSINDLVKLWKDISEDITSIYKRRQDRVLKSVGVGITDALGLGSHLPYFGDYFAGLRGYHDRRYSNTDVEAANKWQESMKFIDSHKVLDMMATTQNKDLLRGGISLLVERGEMDWNDNRVWKTFMRLTGYNMPIEACKRNDVLRDTWMRKMVNALWDDKEQYYHWRQGNDSHIESHKKEFTPMVDVFANVGGMKVELRKQLKLWVEWNHTGPVPDDIKPHLYEEVLHYAMRMGKMSMEDKFFYLIQAVRHGLLSIDRLRVLAGDGGEILLRFPFIDYFYQKNNSMDEVRRLGERLEEVGGPDAKFEPGAKTMYFLQYEVPNEQGFKERLSKALGRDNIEKIDHEDFPMIVANVDYAKTDEMTGVLSGSRYKITKESAKNSYVGFNTKFKAFGRLADLDTANKARFTRGDAQSMAMSITAFLHFDNLLTRNGWDGVNRLTLTWNDINNTAGPSMHGQNVKVYRDSAYAFIHNLIGKLKENGSFKWENVGITQEKYLQQLGAQDDERLMLTAKSPHQTEVYQATAKFARELERALKEDTGTLKNVLSDHSDRDKTRTNYLMEEGASRDKEYLTTESAEQYIASLAQTKNGAAARAVAH